MSEPHRIQSLPHTIDPLAPWPHGRYHGGWLVLTAG